jgi:hypothetical protein
MYTCEIIHRDFRSRCKQSFDDATLLTKIRMDIILIFEMYYLGMDILKRIKYLTCQFSGLAVQFIGLDFTYSGHRIDKDLISLTVISFFILFLWFYKKQSYKKHVASVTC